MSLDSL
jgi:hypothetical protein